MHHDSQNRVHEPSALVPPNNPKRSTTGAPVKIPSRTIQRTAKTRRVTTVSQRRTDHFYRVGKLTLLGAIPYREAIRTNNRDTSLRSLLSRCLQIHDVRCPRKMTEHLGEGTE
ncbi:unnamed protein product [Ectocarpus sp. 8 AP-2014]